MFVNFLALQPGQRIVLKNQAAAAVVENIGDGIWVKGRFIESPQDPSLVGSEELCYCEDVLRIAETA